MNTQEFNGTQASAEQQLLVSKFTQGKSLVSITARERMEQFINHMGYVSGNSDKAYDLNCKLDRCTDLEVRSVYELYITSGSKITFTWLLQNLHERRRETPDYQLWLRSYDSRIQWLNHVFDNIEFFSSISIAQTIDTAPTKELLKHLKLPLGLFDGKARLHNLIENVNPIGIRISYAQVINALTDVEAHAIWELNANPAFCNAARPPLTSILDHLLPVHSANNVMERIQKLTVLFEEAHRTTDNVRNAAVRFKSRSVQKDLF